MPLYITLEPVTYLKAPNAVEQIVGVGRVIELTTDQAALLPGKVAYWGSGSSFLAPRITMLAFDSNALFPVSGSVFHVYLDQATGLLWQWKEELNDYTLVSLGTLDPSDIEGITATGEALLSAANQAAARTALSVMSSAEVTAAIAAAVTPNITPAVTYYVSPTGSDANNGLTTTTAFATPAAALAVAPARAAILLKRGGTWALSDDSNFSGITLNANGILLGAYGTGALPIIDRGTEPTGGLFNDGFESETSAFTTNWNGKTQASTSTATLETANPLRGTKSLKYTHASGSAFIEKDFASQANVYVQFKVKINKLVTGASSSGMRILQLIGGWGLLYLQHDATPKRGLQVRIVGGTPTQDITAPTYYQEGQTLRIELHYRNSAGANATELWVNGVRVVTMATSDPGAATGFYLGGAAPDGAFGAGTELIFDDVKVSTAAIGLGTRGDHGIYIQGDDVVVQDIDVRNTGQNSISLRNCNRATVRRAKLHDSLGHGILAYIGGGGHTIDNCEVWFNGLTQTTFGLGSATQILDTVTTANTISNCSIHHCGGSAGDHGIYSEGGANLFTGNVFREIVGFGIKFNEGSQGSTAVRNRMIACKAGAVQIATSVDSPSAAMTTPVNAYHNSAYMCGHYPGGNSPLSAFFIAGYSQARVLNNIAVNSGYAIEVDSHATLVASDTNDFVFDVSFGFWLYFTGSSGTEMVTIANWRTASGFDGSSIVTDPLFVDADAGNLALQSGSPARNIGTVIPGVNDNYLGAAPDLGYLEGATKAGTFLIDDYGIVDYTGATASDTAVAAAITAMGTGPGILEFGAGTIRLDSTKTLAYPGQGIRGRGVSATILNFRGTGDALRVWDSTVPTNGSTPPGKAAPITGFGIWGWNNANTNTCGLHIGDLDSIHLDIDIQGFNQAGCKGFWGENIYSWSERAFIQCSAELNTQSYVFETNASHPNGQSSWDYSWYFLSMSIAANQNGVVVKNNVHMYGVLFSLVGNVSAGATNTGVALTVGTSGGDDCRMHGLFHIGLETNGASVAAHKDINVGAASQIVGSGFIEMNDAGTPGFAAGTASVSTVKFSGRLSTPSLGRATGGLIAFGPQFDVINDTNGNAVLGFSPNASAVNALTVGNAPAGISPSISAGGATTDLHVVLVPKGAGSLVVYEGSGQSKGTVAVTGSATNVDMDLTTQGSGVVKANSVPVVTTTGAQTETNKTFTSPKINAILDTNGVKILELDTTTSAVNWLELHNNVTGGRPFFGTAGTDTNIGVSFVLKGTGDLQVYQLSGGTATITADGVASSIDLNVITKGTGRLKVNGVAVPTVSSADTETNKTLTTPKVDQLRDTNNAVILHLQPNSSAVNYVEVDNAATGVDPQLYGWSISDTNVGLDLKTKGTGTVKANSVPVVTTTGAQTLTSKTLTDPKINAIYDTSTGAPVATFVGAASAVNYLQFISAATGGVPALTMQGSDTNISWLVSPKGSGGVLIYGNTGQSVMGLGARGSATNVDLDLTSQGTGVVKAGGVPVVTTTGTQTLTNKVLTSPKVDALLDANGFKVLELATTASAVNYLELHNNVTGGRPNFVTAGTDSNIGVSFVLKGTGDLQIYQLSGGTATLTADGIASDIDLNVVTKGTGRLKENGSIAATRVSVPASASATGKTGQFASDANFHYDCIATNTWVRSVAATW